MGKASWKLLPIRTFQIGRRMYLLKKKLLPGSLRHEMLESQIIAQEKQQIRQIGPGMDWCYSTCTLKNYNSTGTYGSEAHCNQKKQQRLTGFFRAVKWSNLV